MARMPITGVKLDVSCSSATVVMRPPASGRMEISPISAASASTPTVTRRCTRTPAPTSTETTCVRSSSNDRRV